MTIRGISGRSCRVEPCARDRLYVVQNRFSEVLMLRLSSLSGIGADLKEGILDPFPLLRTEETRKGKARLVNPLLLVTERKGTASSLHYGSFPLDAFNTDGTGTHP